METTNNCLMCGEFTLRDPEPMGDIYPKLYLTCSKECQLAMFYLKIACLEIEAEGRKLEN